MAACSVCKAQLAPAQVLYNPQAAIVCQSCLDSGEVKSLEARAAASASKAAYGNLFLGVFSLFFNPFWLLSIATIGNLMFVFRQLELDRRRGEVPPDAGVRKGVAIAGAIIGVLSVIFRVMLASRNAQ